MPLTGQNTTVYSVSEVNALARGLLEDAFADIYIQGEISGFKAYQSGHWYFSLKDNDGEIRCVMFRGDNLRVRFRPSDGARVKLRCRVSIYEQRGTYQAIVREMQPAGTGELLAALAALREKLEKEGLMERDRKRAIPIFARHLAIISSPSGAALRDIAKTLQQRSALCECTLLPASVQGANAVGDIVRAFSSIANWPASLGVARPDLVLLARGGGSLEDLWAFNLEPVARAIADCDIPVITGIGHETDTSIADLVADARAATPTAAAAMATPDYGECFTRVDRLADDIGARIQRRVHNLSQDHVAQWRQRLAARSPARIVDQSLQRLDELSERLEKSFALTQKSRGQRLANTEARLARLDPVREIGGHLQLIDSLTQRLSKASARLLLSFTGALDALAQQLEAVSPKGTLARGYAIIAEAGPEGGPAQRFGTPVTSAAQTRVGERLHAHLADGSLEITVQGTRQEKL